MNASAIIVIKGNPPHVKETLESIQDIVSEVVIGDIGIDAELKNSLEKSSRNILVELDKNTLYVELVREELIQKTNNEFVLYLDPDEVFPSKVKQELLENYEKYSFFSFPRKNLIFNKWIQHSQWWPDYKVRFFKKSAVKWQKKLHSEPVVEGKEYKFEAKEENAILHYNYENIDEFMSKLPRYAKSSALEKIQQNSSYTFKDAVQDGISEFITRFFACEGYKDGMHGLVLSFLQMFYNFLVFFYFWELKKYPDDSVKEMVSAANTFFRQGLYETTFWKDKKNLSHPIDKLKIKIVKRL
jgi:(heptosyl)LPS beta-1,4-glucosyltransferase